MRYLKQRDRYACGPIAVLNALKWAGAKVSYNSHFNRIKKLSKCHLDGADYDGLIKAVKNYKSIFCVQENHFVDIGDIDFYLKEGGSIILEYYYRDLESTEGYVGHFVFIPGKWGKYFLVVNNYQKGPAIQICGRRELINMLKNKTFGRDARAIILFKK